MEGNTNTFSEPNEESHMSSQTPFQTAKSMLSSLPFHTLVVVVVVVVVSPCFHIHYHSIFKET